MFKVYKHTTPCGKVYIGITRLNVKYRWNYGRGYKFNNHFNRAIQKYGWDNIRHEVLYDNLTECEAKQKEIELISRYRSNDKNYGYNLMSGGEMAKAIHSEESKNKMRLAKLGKKASDETKAKHSQCQKGHHVSAETREKISLAQKGKPRKKHTEEWKQQMHEYFTNNTWNMKSITQLTTGGEVVKTFNSAKQAERETGFDNRNILAVCKGKRKTAYGYVWAYTGGT